MCEDLIVHAYRSAPLVYLHITILNKTDYIATTKIFMILKYFIALQLNYVLT